MCFRAILGPLIHARSVLAFHTDKFCHCYFPHVARWIRHELHDRLSGFLIPGFLSFVVFDFWKGHMFFVSYSTSCIVSHLCLFVNYGI